MTFDYRFGIRRNTAHPPDPEHWYMTSLSGHIGIVGVTGAGKSNYIRLILHRLEQQNCNVVLFDPHALVTDYALSYTNKKKVFLSGVDYPGSEGKYTGINALQYTSELDAERVADWLVQVFSSEKDLSQGTWGPRLGFVFGTLLARYILENKGSTLSDFARFIADRNTLKDYGEKHKDFPSFGFMEELFRTQRNYIDFITSSMNKLAPIVENSIPKRILCKNQNTAIDLEAILREDNNLVVPDLNEGLIGARTTRVITGMLLAQIWSILLRNANPERKTYIIIDEAESIPLNILSTILLEGRKYGIVLILSFHTFALLDPHLTDSIFSGVRNWACFQVPEAEARLISKNLEPGRYQEDLRQALMKQKLYNVTVYSSTADGVYGPFTLKMPLVPDTDSMKDPFALKASLLAESGSGEAEILSVDLGITHSELISEFSDFLRTQKIEVKREGKLGELVPDLFFQVAGKQVVCEVEESDVMDVTIIAQKLYDYRDFKLLFLCKYEKFKSLIKRLRAISRKVETAKRKYIKQNSRDVLIKSLLSSLSTLYLVVYHEGEFLFYTGETFVEFALLHLTGEGSLMRRARKLPPENLRAVLMDGIMNYIGDKNPMDDATISRYLGKTRIPLLLSVIRERGYDSLTVESLLELDRIDPRVP